MTGAEFVVDFLKKMNTDTVFCYPGVAVLELFDALGKSDINHVLVRHEQGAVFAASGYARASGKVGVCIATSGPGAVNLTTGITDANLDSVPLLVITGQVDSQSIGRDAFQEADIMGITLPVTKHNYLVKDKHQLRAVLVEAYKIASCHRCGPVLVDITKDVLSAEIEDDGEISTPLPRKRNNEYTLEKALSDIEKAIRESYRPVILAGGGVVASSCSEKLAEFSKKSGIPVVVTLMGMGLVVGDDVKLYGMTGVYGNRAAQTALWQSDLCIAVGCRFSDRTVSDFARFESSRRIIHCDVDPAEINKNLRADIAAVCDAGEFFDALNSLDARPDASSLELWISQLDALKTKHVIEEHENRLSNWEIVRNLDECAKERGDCTFVCDVGDFQMAAARELEPIFERGFITSGGLGAMGFGLPAAIGASMHSDGGEQIVLLVGDGGFQMSMQELSTIKKAKKPIKIFIFDNSALRMIVNKQNALYGGNCVDSRLTDNPDFALIAKAYGIDHVTLDVSGREKVKQNIANILKSDAHTIVCCKV